LTYPVGPEEVLAEFRRAVERLPPWSVPVGVVIRPPEVLERKAARRSAVGYSRRTSLLSDRIRILG
jgi:hypothetical protein